MTALGLNREGLDDPGRLAALKATGLLDSAAEEAFDRLTRLAARLTGSPVALVSLVDSERQFFKSEVGLHLRETPLSHSFCQHVVSSGRPLVVDDAREHDLVRDNPAVDDLGVTAYAGVPLEDAAGNRLGSFCVIDSERRHWTEEDLSTLRELAALVMTEIALRQVAAEAESRAAGMERLAAIVEACAEAIIGETTDGTITHWNSGAERIYGYTAAEAIGSSIKMLAVSAEQEAEFDAIRVRPLGGEGIQNIETVRRGRDGAAVEVSITIAPVRDLDGQVVGVSTLASDITTRRAAERRQEHLSRLLTEAQELAGIGSWEIHADDGRSSWTEQMPKIFGISPDRMSAGDSSAMRELIHPEDLAGYQTMLEQVLSSGTPDEVEFRILRPDGEIRLLRSRARRADDAVGFQLVGTIEDVTETRALERGVTEARDLFSGVLDAATETAIIATDRDGRITVFNNGAERMLGYAPKEMIGLQSLTSLHDPDELAARATELGITSGFDVISHSPQAGIPETREWTYIRRDQTRLTVSLTCTALPSLSEGVSGFIAIARDVTEARASELARRQAELRFQAAFEHAPVGVAMSALRGPNSRQFLQTNVALTAMLGREPGKLDGVAIQTISHPDDRDRSDDAFRRLEAGETVITETRYLHTDGRWIWVLVSSTPVPEEAPAPPDYCVTQILDISDRKRLEHQLRQLADHDPLTGLYNRRRFDAELQRILRETTRYGRAGALLMFDLDGFKTVNDRLGHPAGDELVSRIAGLLKQAVRETDIVARLGGDEFAVILHETTLEGADRVANKILEMVRRHGVAVKDSRYARVTTSVGITTFDRECPVSSDELIVEADIALYEAKAKGRDRSSLHSRAESG